MSNPSIYIIQKNIFWCSLITTIKKYSFISRGLRVYNIQYMSCTRFTHTKKTHKIFLKNVKKGNLEQINKIYIFNVKNMGQNLSQFWVWLNNKPYNKWVQKIKSEQKVKKMCETIKKDNFLGSK